MGARSRIDLHNRERWTALALLIGALALAYLLGLHWWWTAPMLELQHKIESLRSEELRLRMQARQRPEIEGRLAEVRAFEQGDPGFLPEATAELATAGLVQRLETVLSQRRGDGQSEHCSITNRTPITSRARERFPRVVVQVRMRCTIEGFADALRALEGGRPQLFVDNLSVQGRRASAGAAAREHADLLDIAFDLYGYLRIASAAAGAEVSRD